MFQTRPVLSWARKQRIGEAGPSPWSLDPGPQPEGWVSYTPRRVTSGRTNTLLQT